MMSSSTETPRLRWGFSVVMLLVYLALFHVWTPFSRLQAATLGAIAAFGLTIGVIEWKRRGYFVNRCDCMAHLVVALDVLLEALLVPVHVGYGFYGCALAFSIVIGGYRLHAWKKEHPPVVGADVHNGERSTPGEPAAGETPSTQSEQT